MSEDLSPIHSAIQASMNTEDANEAQGNVVTGWVCVVESMDPDGRRWLSRLSADASGTHRPPAWAEQGLLFNALYDLSRLGGWDDE